VSEKARSIGAFPRAASAARNEAVIGPAPSFA
jgi:hypothetical protein